MVPVSLYPVLDATISAAERAHRFHVIQERRILRHVHLSTHRSTYDLYIFVGVHQRFVIIDIVLVVPTSFGNDNGPIFIRISSSE